MHESLGACAPPRCDGSLPRLVIRLISSQTRIPAYIFPDSYRAVLVTDAILVTRASLPALFHAMELHVVIFVTACTLILMPVASVKYVRTGHGLFGRPVSSGGTVMSAPRIVSDNNWAKLISYCVH